jgi:hypothetical protein
MDAVLLAGLTFALGIATNWATSRRTLALQYDTELRRERLAVYADLWARLEVLNKYGRESDRLTRVDAQRLVTELKRWYFQVGGIYLSVAARTDYFALQDALQHALVTARSEGAEQRSAGEAELEFVRVRASRLRTSLTRDVGTRKALKLRGDPARPPLPSELGPHWHDGEQTKITLARRRALRLGGRLLGRPVVVSAPSGPESAKWTDMRWDNDAWAILATREEHGERHRRQLLLESDRLVEGPVGWDPAAGSEPPPPVAWERFRPGG